MLFQKLTFGIPIKLSDFDEFVTLLSPAPCTSGSRRGPRTNPTAAGGASPMTSCSNGISSAWFSPWLYEQERTDRDRLVSLSRLKGVSPKLAQEPARHSDIRVTMNVYTHARLYDLLGAVEGLPTLIGHSRPQPQILAATGTEPVCTGFVQTDDSGRHALRLAETTERVAGRNTSAPNPKQIEEFETVCDDVRPSERKLPGQDSNLDKENQNHRGSSTSASRNAVFSPRTRRIRHLWRFAD
jgi:hypothetical protein